MSESDPFHIELAMLREFYASWVSFHRIPRDRLHRKKQEAASQLMIDNHHDLARFYTANKDLSPLPVGLSSGAQANG